MKSSGGAEQRDGEHIKPWQPWGKARTTHTLSHFSSPCTAQVGLRRCSSSSSSFNNTTDEFYFLKASIALRLSSGKTKTRHAPRMQLMCGVQATPGSIYIRNSMLHKELSKHQTKNTLNYLENRIFISLFAASCKRISFSLLLKCCLDCPHLQRDRKQWPH